MPAPALPGRPPPRALQCILSYSSITKIDCGCATKCSSRARSSARACASYVPDTDLQSELEAKMRTEPPLSSELSRADAMMSHLRPDALRLSLVCDATARHQRVGVGIWNSYFDKYGVDVILTPSQYQDSHTYRVNLPACLSQPAASSQHA